MSSQSHDNIMTTQAMFTIVVNMSYQNNEIMRLCLIDIMCTFAIFRFLNVYTLRHLVDDDFAIFKQAAILDILELLYQFKLNDLEQETFLTQNIDTNMSLNACFSG